MEKFENMGHSLNGESGFENMFESVKTEKAPTETVEPVIEQEPQEVTEQMFLESVANDHELMMEALDKSSETTWRAQAMSATIAIVEEGFTKADDLDSFAIGLADVDEDGEVSESEQADYDVAVNVLAEAFVKLGADSESVKKAFEGDDDAAEKVILAAQDTLDDVDDTDKLIAAFAVKEQLMMEASKKRVIRDGKAVWIKKPLRKRRMSSAQKQALKKARRKANSSAAKRARAKSMKLRKNRGL